MKEGTILQLFAGKSAVPVEAAYQLSVLVDRPEGLEDRAEFARSRVERSDAGGDLEGACEFFGSIATCGADEA